MNEQTFLNSGNILITSTRCDINGQTFATRNISSVKVVKPNFPIISIFLTVIFIIGAVSARELGPAIFCGLVALLCGAIAYARIKRRTLVLIAGAGEVKALESHDAAAIEALRSAIASAISVR